jgi:hypothetical protein
VPGRAGSWEKYQQYTKRVLWSTNSMKFLYFLRVVCPLCCPVYPGTLAASTWYMDVLEPGFPSSCVMYPRYILCDLFLPLFSQKDRHLGIWHIATCRVALM